MTKLYELVNKLSDRDAQLKKDMNLFEEFFETFPIPVTMWSISSEKTLLSKRGNGFVCHKASCLDDLFICPDVKALSIEKHQEALQGQKVDYFAKSDKNVYYVKLLPRYDDDKKICGVTGVSWDVTANAVILSCLEDIFECTKNKKSLYGEINSKVKKALDASRLRALMMVGEE